jgi:hypothetical protein
MTPKTSDGHLQLAWHTNSGPPLDALKTVMDLHFAGAYVGRPMKNLIEASLTRPVARAELAEHAARVRCGALRASFALHMLFRSDIAVGATPCYRCGLPTGHRDALDQPLCSTCDEQINVAEPPLSPLGTAVTAGPPRPDASSPPSSTW